MSEWAPSKKVDRLAGTMSPDQQIFGMEIGRRIPARQHRRTTDIELPSPHAQGDWTTPGRAQTASARGQRLTGEAQARNGLRIKQPK